MKKKSRQSKEDSPMPVDLFEREYADEITWQVEVLLGDGEFKESEYDEAYEKAIEIVAKDKGIELI
jgi:formylmethanofuran dehydrogenase subunit B